MVNGKVLKAHNLLDITRPVCYMWRTPPNLSINLPLPSYYSNLKLPFCFNFIHNVIRGISSKNKESARLKKSYGNHKIVIGKVQHNLLVTPQTTIKVNNKLLTQNNILDKNTDFIKIQ